MANNYKIKPAAVSDFSCSGCSSFEDYLTKANIQPDSEGFYALDQITTTRNVDMTWRANNLAPRYKTYFQDGSRATYNRLLLSDIWDESFIGRAKINGFTVNGVSPNVVLAGTIPNFTVGITFPGSADYYYGITRHNDKMEIYTLNRGNNSRNYDVKLMTIHVYADGTDGASAYYSENVNSYTFTTSHFLSPIPFRGVCWACAGGGAGATGAAWTSGGGGAGGGVFGGILDFLGDTTNNTFHIYVGKGGSPGENGQAGGDTIIYGWNASGSPYYVARAPGGTGGRKGADAAAIATSSVTNNMNWGLVFTNSSGTETRTLLTSGSGKGGKPNEEGGDVSWGTNTKFHSMPYSSRWGFKGYGVSNHEGGETSSSFGGGGGASAWADGEGFRNGWNPSSAQWGAGGGGLRYGMGLSSGAPYKWGGHGGDGYVDLYF